MNKKKPAKKGGPGAETIAAPLRSEGTLYEVSWETCNQIGGIYSVIRSKAPVMVERWRDRYVLVGPYFASSALSEFEGEPEADDALSRAMIIMRREGIEAFAGRWLVTGKPKAVLINVFSVFERLPAIRRTFQELLGVAPPLNDDLVDQVLAFGFCLQSFFRALVEVSEKDGPVIAHFHEWMAGAAVGLLRRANLNLPIVFTTHATLLGRYIATNSLAFYDDLPRLDWEREARQYNIEARVRLERTAAAGAHCLATVSEVTARECEILLGRAPDVITPNGLNIERFAVLHEFQNLHREYKEMITQFVLGHFFPSYTFDLDRTIYFFTSGRYEYRNKGFDLTLEALYRLNRRLREEHSPVTVVMFFITKKPVHSINPHVLHSRALTEEIRKTCDAMLKQVQDKLIYEVAARRGGQLPPLNSFIDDYWKLRLKRTLATWKTDRLPIIVTHNLVNDADDEILNYLRRTDLVNHLEDRVKIVYHPDFITPTNPLFGMEYNQFVRGCHLGIFPSSYEPWGYTPLECIANGIPAVTSDLSGFGDYTMRTLPEHDQSGIWVVKRKGRSFAAAAEDLTEVLHSFVQMSRRDRITNRNAVEKCSASFDWHELADAYDRAYECARRSCAGV